MENDSKVSNVPLDNNHVKEDKSDEPSECKIPKTDPTVSETKSETQPPSEIIDVKVVYNKNKYDVSAPSNTTIADFKKQLQSLVGPFRTTRSRTDFTVTVLQVYRTLCKS